MSPLVDAVLAICQRATAHNYGQTVLWVDQEFASRDVTVQMSSWPRADEAVRALVEAGYQARHLDDCSVLVEVS